jgi:hypothetical protein
MTYFVYATCQKTRNQNQLSGPDADQYLAGLNVSPVEGEKEF